MNRNSPSSTSKSGTFVWLTISLAILAACTAAPPKGDSGPLTVFRGEAQGTTYSIKYTDSVEVEQGEIDSILQEIDHALSAWDEGSTLSAFNRADTITIADPLFLEAFRLGKNLSEATSGAFHPMVMPLVRAWGFGPEGGRLKEGLDLDSLKLLVTYDFTALPTTARPDGPVFFSKPQGVQLDVNSYVPGYSVDVVSDFLRRRGIRNFMVEIGGELYARGRNENGKVWRIGIDKPVSPHEPRELEAVVEVDGKALATSGTYRKFYEVDGRKYSHTIDPRTGHPVDHNLLSVTVMAEDAAGADAYATAFMVFGPEGTKSFLKNHPELGLEVFLIFQDGPELSTYFSSGMKNSIEMVD